VRRRELNRRFVGGESLKPVDWAVSAELEDRLQSAPEPATAERRPVEEVLDEVMLFGEARLGVRRESRRMSRGKTRRRLRGPIQ
jgi:hypothetical protein